MRIDEAKNWLTWYNSLAKPSWTTTPPTITYRQMFVQHDVERQDAFAQEDNLIFCTDTPT